MLVLSGAAGGQTLNTDSLIQKTQDAIDKLLYKTQDTNYIKDYSDELALYLLSQLKLNNFGVWDRNSNSLLWYTPSQRSFIGIGGSYKWFGLEIAFNVDPFNRQSEELRFFDFQASAFTRKDFIEAALQYYYGYQIAGYSPSTIPLTESSYERGDIRTINLGLQFYHVFEYGKFSLRAPFLMTQFQKKSAGSVIGGANFALFIMDADSSVVPRELYTEFNPQLRLRDLNFMGLATNWGYIHTFVYKKFFFTLSAMPGISLNAGDYFADSRTFISPHLAFSFKTMNAIGYNSRRFFTGFRFLGDLITVRVESKLNYLISRGRLKFYIGWRFKNKKGKQQ